MMLQQDTRRFFYISIAQLLAIIAVGLIIKVVLFDLYKINGEQMSPTAVNGDRILIFRTPYLPLLRSVFRTGLNKPVLIHLPVKNGGYGFLRVAGRSGDTVSIYNGEFFNSSKTDLHLPPDGKMGEILPEDYSPRDNFKPLRIPAPGDTISLNDLSVRDFFFIYSIIKQENNEADIKIKADLLIDDSVSNDYIINGFSLYKGAFDSIKEPNRNDWFFWTHLEDYLRTDIEDRNVFLDFSMFINDIEINTYRVKKSYVFLLADNWNNGLDSRYFGPVQRSNIKGRAFLVLWSYGKGSGKHLVNLKRFGRIVQ